MNEQEMQSKAVAAALEQVQNHLQQKDSERALAEKIAGLTTSKAIAEQKLAEAAEQIAASEKARSEQVAAVASELESLKAELETVATAKAELEKQLSDAQKAKAELDAQLVKIGRERTIAERKAKVQALGEAAATDRRVELAAATTDQGELKLSDDVFELFLAEWAEQAKATSTTETTTDETEGGAPDGPDLDAAKAAEAERALASLNQSAPNKGASLREQFAKHL